MEKLNKSRQRQPINLENLELGKDSKYYHPFTLEGSPFYHNSTSETLLEITENKDKLRPFDLSELEEIDHNLINLRDN